MCSRMSKAWWCVTQAAACEGLDGVNGGWRCTRGMWDTGTAVLMV